MKNITQNEFRELLDKLELLHKKIDDRALVVPFPADEDFDRPINIAFGANLKRSDALEFCNAWNREKISPKAYLDESGDFFTEISLFHDEDISAEYVQNNFIRLTVAAVAQFFKELKQFVDGKSSDEGSV